MEVENLEIDSFKIICAYVNSSERIYVLLGISPTWAPLHYTIVPWQPKRVFKSLFLTDLQDILMPPLVLTRYTLVHAKESKWQWVAVGKSLEWHWAWERPWVMERQILISCPGTGYLWWGKSNRLWWCLENIMSKIVNWIKKTK